MSTPVARLVQDLRRLGVEDGGVVMVHASLRAIGPVEGGAAGVVEALDRAVGPGGTVVMVLGARDDSAWVNDRPEAEREALLAGAAPFDALATPADPGMGALAEVFRRTPGTRVSDHPEGRFGARGLMDRHFVFDVPWDDYHGPGSPLERLVDAGGKVLRLGADADTVTLIHYAEYLAAVPNKRRVRRHRLVAAAGGPAIRTVECLDDNRGIVDYPAGDYFADILAAYLERGTARQGRVGRARSELIDAKDLVEFAVRWMTGRFGATTEWRSPLQGAPMFKSNAVRSLVELHEAEMDRFWEAWQAFRTSGTRLPQTDDPNYQSAEHLGGHVMRAARNYLTWIGQCAGRPVTDVDLDTDVMSIARKGRPFLDEILSAWRRHLSALEDGELEGKAYESRWGEPYNIEQMLEHAVVHPMRHRRQLERLMGR